MVIFSRFGSKTFKGAATDSGDLKLDLENLSPADTLAGSKLLEIDVEEASQEEIKQEFCREIKAVSLKYSEPQVIKLIKQIQHPTAISRF